jgi:hypothetical protein
MADSFFSFVANQNNLSVDDYVLRSLERKISTYAAFFKKYPGYASFLPWYAVHSDGIAPQPGWENRVPSLDNGEWIWGIYAVAGALELSPAPQAAQLSARYWTLFTSAVDSAKRVFYDADKKGFRCVTNISDMFASPLHASYGWIDGDGCLLDDPYEGELFVFFADLFAEWPSAEEREQVWVNRRHKLQAIDFDTPHGPVTVQKGWWFSAHEQWKIWELPYLRTNARPVFLNCEKARTWHAATRGIPGLGASVSGVPGECANEGYVSAIGVQELAFEKVTCDAIVTPYAATPLIADEESRGVGLAWYAMMINGSRGQGPFGSTEAASALQQPSN